MALTHHYLFDTATGFNDSITSGGLNLTSVIGAIGSSGKINQCLQWTYSSGADAANSSSQVLPTTGSAFSIAFWIKTTPDSMFSGNFIKNSSGFRIVFSPNGSAVGIRYSSMSYLNEAEAAYLTWSLSTFQHVAITFDGATGGFGGTGTWNFYINGSLYATQSGVSGTPLTTGNFVIGEGWDTTNYIDDLRIYDAVIDSTEVAFIYNSGAGTQAESSGTAGSASGSLATITMSGPAGSASSGTPGSASGGIGTIVMSGPSGSASVGGADAFGALGIVSIVSIAGSASSAGTASGSIPSLAAVAPSGAATGTGLVQLSYCSCDAEIGWKQSLPIDGFSSAVQGEDSASARVTPTVSLSDANIVFFEKRTLAAASSQTYDLRALTDFLGNPLAMSRVYGISIYMISGSSTVSPGASNPLQWFFNSATANINVSSGNCFMFAQKNSAIVDSSAKTITVTNPSGISACVYKIAILGGR